MDLQAVIRAVCKIVDAFHFHISPVEGGSSPLPGPVRALKDPLGLPPEDQEGEARDDGEPGQSSGSDDAAGIQASLTRRVLPVLQAALVRPSHLSCAIPTLVAVHWKNPEVCARKRTLAVPRLHCDWSVVECGLILGRCAAGGQGWRGCEAAGRAGAGQAAAPAAGAGDAGPAPQGLAGGRQPPAQPTAAHQASARLCEPGPDTR